MSSCVTYVKTLLEDTSGFSVHRKLSNPQTIFCLGFSLVSGDVIGIDLRRRVI